MRWLLLALVAIFDTRVLVLAKPLAHHEIVILIISQSDPFHRRHAHRLRQDILDQSQPQPPPRVLLTHEDFADVPGAWAVSPLLLGNGLLESAVGNAAKQQRIDAAVESLISGNDEEEVMENQPVIKWLVVCEARSHIVLRRLVERLDGENHEQELFLGHALHDQEATIVHHFAFFENPTVFRYPTFRAGIALSWTMVRRLRQRASSATAPKLASEFAIDAAHELAMFVWDEGRGYKLTHATYFCLRTAVVEKHRSANEQNTMNTSSKSVATTNDDDQGEMMSQCAVYSRAEDGDDDDDDDDDEDCVTVEDSNEATCEPNSNSKSNSTHLTSVIFAVKTCMSFHVDRVPVIQNTWAKQVKHIRYYSDSYDPTIPTINTGVPNTDTGHCQKMIRIFELLLREIDASPMLRKDIRWIVLADDDTLLSIKNLLNFLHRFDASGPVYLGERYGFRLFAPDGLNYVTGGGGIVLSLIIVRRLLAAGCECPTRSAPDDMILGVCMRQLGVEPTHSEQFHQARPTDYPTELLTSGPPLISFHKYWQIDPYAVFAKWLSIEATTRNRSTTTNSPPTQKHSIKKANLDDFTDPIKMQQKPQIKNNEL